MVLVGLREVVVQSAVAIIFEVEVVVTGLVRRADCLDALKSGRVNGRRSEPVDEVSVVSTFGRNVLRRPRYRRRTFLRYSFCGLGARRVAPALLLREDNGRPGGVRAIHGGGRSFHAGFCGDR